jgi:hypothetical protein
VVAIPAAATSGRPIVIPFSKDCPELTCEETPGSPVEVSTVITPVSFADGILHYTAVETISSAKGSVTLSLSGLLDTNREPDVTVLTGTVTSGSWKGKSLTGAWVHGWAVRVSGTTFAGVITIKPAATD